MRRAILTSSLLAALLMLAVPAAALANGDGEGLYGQTNDLVAAAVGGSLIVLFPLIIFIASMVQSRLDRRKDAHKAAIKARAQSAEWRRGW
jgi:hypothetical protein